MSASAEPYPTPVGNCARCGEDHSEVVFQPLSRPIMSGDRGEGDEDEVEWSHWAPCPTNGEPILLRVGTGRPQVFACARGSS